MRISDRSIGGGCLVLVAMLAACSPAADPAARHQPHVPCARGDAPLAPVCTVERATTSRGPVLTLRAPDGGFRRLLVTRDGRGVVAADGAEAATVSIAGGGSIDVRIGGDRYRLPATIEARR